LRGILTEREDIIKITTTTTKKKKKSEQVEQNKIMFWYSDVADDASFVRLSDKKKHTKQITLECKTTNKAQQIDKTDYQSENRFVTCR
jgi:DNA-directed RNA polymerase delta subunit